jgi:DNA-binding GntR family transcriptional regulator
MPIKEQDDKLLSPLVRSRTIADEIAERIVLAIASGEQEPGSRLTEGALAEAMKVSRVPAREALQSLAAKGVLVSAGARGLKVVEFSKTQARQVIEVRMALETMGMTRAMAKVRSDPTLLPQIDAILKEMAGLSKKPNAIALAQCDLRFHRKLMTFSDNELLVKTWDGLSAHLLILFCRDWHRNANKVGEVELHSRLRDFVLNGDPGDITRELALHFVFT